MNITLKMKKVIGNLPKDTGVYFFYQRKEVIYIGKAANLKERIKSHFYQPSYRDRFFIHRVTNIGFTKTQSEIEALVLEANLIKKYRPKFNVAWRDDKNYFYVVIARNRDGLPYVYLTHQPKVLRVNTRQSEVKNIGPFVEGKALKKTINYLRRVIPFYTSQKHPKGKCSWCHLELCPGPNPNAVQYRKDMKNLLLILEGKSKKTLRALNEEMKCLAQRHDFEKAAQVRDRIFSLKKTLSHTSVISPHGYISHHGIKGTWQEIEFFLRKTLLLNKKIQKIECYDVSNIQGKFATGSMAVFINGIPVKNQYKKFRIKMKNTPNDTGMLKEILMRRLLHLEWKYPEVMLIDGGKGQLHAALKVKNQYPKVNSKIISLAKGKRELFIEGRKKPIPLTHLPRAAYNLIVHLDDEAHRFAITYHKKIRKRNLLPDA